MWYIGVYKPPLSKGGGPRSGGGIPVRNAANSQKYGRNYCIVLRIPQSFARTSQMPAPFNKRAFGALNYNLLYHSSTDCCNFPPKK